MFGYVRVMGRWKGDKFTEKLETFVKGPTYDEVAVFGVNEKSLDKRLFRADEWFKGETAYEGIVHGDALTRMWRIPVTKKLETFVGSVQGNVGLAKYVGMDLMKYLGAKQYDVTLA